MIKMAPSYTRLLRKVGVTADQLLHPSAQALEDVTRSLTQTELGEDVLLVYQRRLLQEMLHKAASPESSHHGVRTVQLTNDEREALMQLQEFLTQRLLKVEDFQENPLRASRKNWAMNVLSAGPRSLQPSARSGLSAGGWEI